MFDNPVMVFAAVAGIGLLIMIVGFKLDAKTRKAVETAGALVFHIGVFGVLYHKVPVFLFVSLAALVMSLFILVDPLSIRLHVNARIFRLAGFLLLAASVIFSLSHFTGFPPSLWVIPLLIYLLPYLVPTLKKNLKTILTIAWIVVLFYLGAIGYIIYGKYYPANNPIMQNLFPAPQRESESMLETEDEETPPTLPPTSHSETQPPALPDAEPPLLPAGPSSKDEPLLPAQEPEAAINRILKAANEEALRLQQENSDLKKNIRQILEENRRLRKALKESANKLN